MGILVCSGGFFFFLWRACTYCVGEGEGVAPEEPLDADDGDGDYGEED